MPYCMPSSYPFGRFLRITSRTAEMAGRRSSGRPFKYSSTVDALLVMNCSPILKLCASYCSSSLGRPAYFPFGGSVLCHNRRVEREWYFNIVRPYQLANIRAEFHSCEETSGLLPGSK